MTGRIVFILIIIFFQIPGLIRAQVNAGQIDTEILKTYFDDVFGGDERLVNGPYYYADPGGTIDGHPFYFNKDWKKGIIRTEEVVYTDINIRYDIAINSLVLSYLSSESSVNLVCLNSENIESFKMDESEFIPLPRGNDSVDVIFAERMSHGPVDYLITRQKSVEVSGSASFYDYEYKEYLKQYLLYGGELIQFGSRRVLYKLFPDHKKQIRDFARENRMVFIRKKITEKKKLVDYCNSLL